MSLLASEVPPSTIFSKSTNGTGSYKNAANGDRMASRSLVATAQREFDPIATEGAGNQDTPHNLISARQEDYASAGSHDIAVQPTRLDSEAVDVNVKPELKQSVSRSATRASNRVSARSRTATYEDASEGSTVPKALIPSQRARWTAEEDEQLVEAVKISPALTWLQIAQKLDRPSQGCMMRWYNHVGKSAGGVSRVEPDEGDEADGLAAMSNKTDRSKRWSETDDQMLIAAVKNHGLKWNQISATFGDSQRVGSEQTSERNARACRERWAIVCNNHGWNLETSPKGIQGPFKQQMEDSPFINGTEEDAYRAGLGDDVKADGIASTNGGTPQTFYQRSLAAETKAAKTGAEALAPANVSNGRSVSSRSRPSIIIPPIIAAAAVHSQASLSPNSPDSTASGINGKQPQELSSVVLDSKPPIPFAPKTVIRGRRTHAPEDLQGTLFSPLGKERKIHCCPAENCGAAFKRSEHLKRHYRSVHMGAKPFPCRWEPCGKSFSRKDNLQQHLHMVHGVRPGEESVAGESPQNVVVRAVRGRGGNQNASGSSVDVNRDENEDELEVDEDEDDEEEEGDAQFDPATKDGGRGYPARLTYSRPHSRQHSQASSYYRQQLPSPYSPAYNHPYEYPAGGAAYGSPHAPSLRHPVADATAAAQYNRNSPLYGAHTLPPLPVNASAAQVSLPALDPELEGLSSVPAPSKRARSPVPTGTLMEDPAEQMSIAPEDKRSIPRRRLSAEETEDIHRRSSWAAPNPAPPPISFERGGTTTGAGDDVGEGTEQSYERTRC